MNLMKRNNDKQNLSIHMVSHDLPTVRTYEKEVMWLHQGKVLHGSVSELLSPQKIEEILDLEMH